MICLRNLLVALLFALTVTIPSRADNEDNQAATASSHVPESLRGVWVAEKVLSAGQEVPAEKFPFELHLTDRQLIFKFVGPIQGKDRVHELRWDTTQDPATIDMIRTVDGQELTVLAIYKVEDEKLFLCFTRGADRKPATTRPTSFESSGSNKAELLILKRQPDSPPAGE